MGGPVALDYQIVIRTTIKMIYGCLWATGILVVKPYPGLNESFMSMCDSSVIVGSSQRVYSSVALVLFATLQNISNLFVFGFNAETGGGSGDLP